MTFQSTHPVRGATQIRMYISSQRLYFNPRTPCGVRHFRHSVYVFHIYFNPRTPCGVRHSALTARHTRVGISIHAPRAGCDGKHAQLGLLLFLQLHQIGCMLAFIILVLTYNFNRKCDRSRIRRCETPRISMFASASHRVKASAIPPAHRSAWRRHARHDFDNCCRDCRSANCPFPGQSAPPSDA